MISGIEIRFTGKTTGSLEISLLSSSEIHRGNSTIGLEGEESGQEDDVGGPYVGLVSRRSPSFGGPPARLSPGGRGNYVWWRRPS
ncbi:hypothetical protein QJS04_geneDACA006470 [Acorus gramineus]|uniref:Uncharacterized protein n=1 Tax=Acorus gramineus TaxID=55184 RepID=A0AAV9AV49_ACOGR|nr:hypothetical protein QJS04_geneDACA006470 [Acorus gramineus]